MKIEPLARAWLDELNLLHLLKDSAVSHEREKMLSKANRAAQEVEEVFLSLKTNGKLKSLTSRYKVLKSTQDVCGKKPMLYAAFELEEKKKLIRQFAREQRGRAQRGISPWRI